MYSELRYHLLRCEQPTQGHTLKETDSSFSEAIVCSQLLNYRWKFTSSCLLPYWDVDWQGLIPILCGHPQLLCVHMYNSSVMPTGHGLSQVLLVSGFYILADPSSKMVSEPWGAGMI